MMMKRNFTSLFTDIIPLSLNTELDVKETSSKMKSMVTKLSSGSGIGTSISADSGGGGTNGDTDKLSGKDINYISV